MAFEVSFDVVPRVGGVRAVSAPVAVTAVAGCMHAAPVCQVSVRSEEERGSM